MQSGFVLCTKILHMDHDAHSKTQLVRDTWEDQ